MDINNLITHDNFMSDDELLNGANKQSEEDEEDIENDQPTEPRWVSDPQFGKTCALNRKRIRPKLFKTQKTYKKISAFYFCKDCGVICHTPDSVQAHRLAHIHEDQRYLDLSKRLICHICTASKFTISFLKGEELKQHCEDFHQAIDFWKNLAHTNDNPKAEVSDEE